MAMLLKEVSQPRHLNVFSCLNFDENINMDFWVDGNDKRNYNTRDGQYFFEIPQYDLSDLKSFSIDLDTEDF